MSSESTEIRILRNSVYLTIQPLILNIISMVAIGYIARKLGPSDFGIFNFITIFIMLFYPIGIMGLDNVAIRGLASFRQDKLRVQSYFSNILSLRMLLALLTIFIISIAGNIIGYSERTLYAVYLGTAILFFQLLGECLTDIFRSYERMEFVALASMIGGLTLTILSVVILFLGYGLFELIGVYALGQLIILLIAAYINEKHFIQIRLTFNPKFWKAVFLEGLPFFLMAAMWFPMERMDTIFLSKFASTEELGIYTTSLILVNRLGVVPQSIGNSFYPALSNYSAAGKIDEMAAMIRKYLKFIFIIATPLFILLSFYSDQIIFIIFGEQYRESGYIFKFMSWVIFIRFFGSISFSILSAIKKQNAIVIVYICCLIFSIFSNFSLTVNFKIFGALIALMSTQFIISLSMFIVAYKEIPNLLNPALILKVGCLNICIYLLLCLIERAGLMITDYSNMLNTIISATIISIVILILYAGMLVLFKIISVSDIFIFKKIFYQTRKNCIHIDS